MPFRSMTTARSHRLDGDNRLARVCRDHPFLVGSASTVACGVIGLATTGWFVTSRTLNWLCWCCRWLTAASHTAELPPSQTGHHTTSGVSSPEVRRWLARPFRSMTTARSQCLAGDNRLARVCVAIIPFVVGSASTEVCAPQRLR